MFLPYTSAILRFLINGSCTNCLIPQKMIPLTQTVPYLTTWLDYKIVLDHMVISIRFYQFFTHILCCFVKHQITFWRCQITSKLMVWKWSSQMSPRSSLSSNPFLSGWGHNLVGLDEWQYGRAHLHTLSNMSVKFQVYSTNGFRVTCDTNWKLAYFHYIKGHKSVSIKFSWMKIWRCASLYPKAVIN